MTRPPSPDPSAPQRAARHVDWTVLAQRGPEQAKVLHTTAADQHDTTRAYEWSGTNTSDASIGHAEAVPTVLIADDEPDVRELARILLEVDGFEVVGEAINGQDALDRFNALNPPPTPTAVLLDNRMPGMTGLQAAALILEQHPDQVIVLFSAFLDEHVEQQARETGVTACLSKRHAADLPDVLRNLLGI